MTTIYGGDDPFTGNVVTGSKLDSVVLWHGTALPVGAANKIPQFGIFMKLDSLSAPTTVDRYIQTSSTISSPNFVLIPVEEKAGFVKMFAGLDAQIPTGYLRCNGNAISRTTYATLFTAIGTEWGIGDGSTTFNLPNMETANSFPRAADQDSEIAGTGGESEHILTEAELAPHSHDLTFYPSVGTSRISVANLSTGSPTTNTDAVDSTGSGDAHENKPPYKSFYFVIKT